MRRTKMERQGRGGGGSDGFPRILISVCNSGRKNILTLILISIGILLCFFEGTESHVGLTFPPARKYDLDFLDKIRTKAPCGMPKSPAYKTSLMSGSKLNVTWHLSYPHRGGYRLELMDNQERPLFDLTPKTDKEDYIKGDPTAQWHMVELPKNFTCNDCTIRLLREASEWSGNYRFWSCADVDIVEPKKYKETCSSHGRPIAGRCVCNKGFSGSRCQYEDECDTDTECTNGNGKCIHLGGTALPKKQCFCNPGFHGEKCSKRNAVKLPTHSQPLDLKRHTKRVLSDRMVLYYRTVPAAKEENKEIEFVLIINGTSYGAIGWRPSSFDKTCKRWPYIENSTTTSTTGQSDRQGKSTQLPAASEPHPEAEAEPKAESESEPSAEPKSDAPVAESEPKAESEPEAEAEPTGDKNSETVTQSQRKASKPLARSDPQEETTTPKLRTKTTKSVKLPEGTEVNVETSSIYVTRSNSRQKRAPEDSKAEPEPESESEPESEPEKSAEGKAEPESESEPEGEPSGGSHSHHHKHVTGATKEPRPSEWAPKGDFHAMDCIDLIMGGAQGIHSRIRDYYTRDRSTPRLDSFWGGKESITSATGWEKDGETTLIFRRKVVTNDEPDHALEGELHVIWARVRYSQWTAEFLPNPVTGEPPPQFFSSGYPYLYDKVALTGVVNSRSKSSKTRVAQPSGDRDPNDPPDNDPSDEDDDDEGNPRRRRRHGCGNINQGRDLGFNLDMNTAKPTGIVTVDKKGQETPAMVKPLVRYLVDAFKMVRNRDVFKPFDTGQEPGEYHHSPKSGLEVELNVIRSKRQPSSEQVHSPRPEFYARDEIKYHGHGGQRGITRIDFLQHQQVEGSETKKKIECGDSWSYPPGCSNDDKDKLCNYVATWVFQPESNSVEFTIESRSANKWTGIGFSDSPQMKNSDAILGWVTTNGQFFVMDTYMTSYVAPLLDKHQDVSGITGKYEDGLARLQFTRPVKSEMDHEKDVSLDKCRFFLFPVEGGTYDAVSKKIRQHEKSPIASPEKICVPTTCRRKPPPKTPTHLKYTFDIKLTGGLGNNWQPPSRDSEDFTQLGNRLRRDLETRLKGIPGYSSMQLAGVTKEGDEVVAKLNLMVKPQSELADKEKVEQVLKDTIAGGRAGQLQVDPKYLHLVQEQDVREADEGDDDVTSTSDKFTGQKFWIVLGCVAALIVLALVQAGLTIYKSSSGKSSSHKGSPSSGSGMAWRDYSGGHGHEQTNYGYDAYSDEKQLQNAMPLQTNPSHANGHGGHRQHHTTDHGGHYATSKNGGYHHQDNGAPPPSYSLPRTAHHQAQHHPNNNRGGGHAVASGGGGGGGLSSHNSDFYFMPSQRQRKYSGEVVRVMVNHNKR